MRRNGKYNNRPVELDGHRFDSQAEAARWTELKMLQAAGEIMHIEVHPRFLLIDSFTHNGRKVRAVYYEADFRYLDRHSGRVIVEDVKGVKTAVFQLKEKLLMSRYPYLDFRVVAA